MGFWKNTRTLRRDRRRLRKKEEAIYNAIKEKPELVPVSKKLATRSIVFSILTILTTVLTIVLAYFAIANLFTDNILTSLLLIIPVGAILLYIIVMFFAKAVICLIYQFRLNKKAHTWWALALVILSAIVAIVSPILAIVAIVSPILAIAL